MATKVCRFLEEFYSTMHNKANLANSPNCCSGQYNTPATCPSSGVAYYSYFSEWTNTVPCSALLTSLTSLQRATAPTRTPTPTTRAAAPLSGPVLPTRVPTTPSLSALLKLLLTTSTITLLSIHKSRKCQERLCCITMHDVQCTVTELYCAPFVARMYRSVSGLVDFVLSVRTDDPRWICHGHPRTRLDYTDGRTVVKHHPIAHEQLKLSLDPSLHMVHMLGTLPRMVGNMSKSRPSLSNVVLRSTSRIGQREWTPLLCSLTCRACCSRRADQGLHFGVNRRLYRQQNARKCYAIL